MARFDVPNIPTTYSFPLSDLLGVDYNETIVDNRRSPRMENLVNNNGFLESINGHKILINLEDAPINGAWNIDANDEIFVVHCGTNLYEVDNEFETKVLIRTDLADVKSTGIYLNGKLLILDGVRALIYHEKDGDWVVENLDEIGYIPTTSIGRAPSGINGVANEPINLASAYRINSFTSDGEATEYVLDGEVFDEETPIVTKLTQEGTIVPVEIYSWDSDTGKVVFETPIEKPPIDKADNVFIKFKTRDVVCYINNCTFGTLYGYEGNNNRAFVTGNSEFPNIDWHSYLDDLTYFPSNSYSKIGVAPITAYSRAGDGSLVIHKKLSDTDCTVYYRSYNTLNGQQIFPLSTGVKNIGCLTHLACCNFLNDPVFLSELGVYSLTANTGTTNERFAEDRGYYITPKLLKENDLEKAVAIVNGSRYYLAVNDNIYVADKRFLSDTEYSDSTYQYEWFVLKDVPVSIFFNWNNKLYFGDNEGNIRTFGDDYVNEFTEPSKNLFTLDNISSGSNKGITYSINGSEMILNGTSNDRGTVIASTPTGITLPAGTYILSINKSGTYDNGGIDSNDTAIYIHFSTPSVEGKIKADYTIKDNLYFGRTFTFTEDTTLSFQLYCNSTNQTFTNLKLQFQIEKGDVESEYTPFGKVIVEEPVKVYWESPFLYFNNYTNAKTVRRIFVHSIPLKPTKFEVGYITADGEQMTATVEYDGINQFPKVLQEKEKISKIMNCKLYIKNNDNVSCSFNSIICEYRIAGKYRGE